MPLRPPVSRRDIARDGLPDFFEIDGVVLVDEKVAHPRDDPPGDVWVGFPRLSRQTPGAFLKNRVPTA
jgi:hypothetical protein